jgi:hypothetical protein
VEEQPHENRPPRDCPGDELAEAHDNAPLPNHRGWDRQADERYDRKPTTKALTAKWVFTRKIDGETGKPAAYKACWVTKGFQQREGVDYTELFASVAHKNSIRVFLSLVN